MQHDDEAHLFEVVRHCKLIRDFTKHMDSAEYQLDVKTRLAVERAFINIGEALVTVSRQNEHTRERLPAFSQVVAFRNVLVHNYLQIKNDEVWAIIQNFVPALERQAETWLAELENVANET